jgi:hypothetical protein
MFRHTKLASTRMCADIQLQLSKNHSSLHHLRQGAQRCQRTQRMPCSLSSLVTHKTTGQNRQHLPARETAGTHLSEKRMASLCASARHRLVFPVPGSPWRSTTRFQDTTCSLAREHGFAHLRRAQEARSDWMLAMLAWYLAASYADRPAPKPRSFQETAQPGK